MKFRKPSTLNLNKVEQMYDEILNIHYSKHNKTSVGKFKPLI